MIFEELCYGYIDNYKYTSIYIWKTQIQEDDCFKIQIVCLLGIYNIEIAKHTHKTVHAIQQPHYT